MVTCPDHTTWTALPHSKMSIENTEGEQSRNEPPVNHRIQNLVANRAGYNPTAAWFRRSESEADTFPGLLIREDRHDEADHDVRQCYLMRKAPRLLMLQSLSHEDRARRLFQQIRSNRVRSLLSAGRNGLRPNLAGTALSLLRC